MLLFKRPKKPRGFASSVRKAEKALSRQIANGLEPVFDERLWKRHKASFMKAQHDKCGYCEVISINHPGAVEHYAPKSQVDELIEEGAKAAPGTSIPGRRTLRVCERGYWWLAYSWENWLFTCERCNSGWKRCLFPIRGASRTSSPRRGVRETMLLLNPFGRIDPVKHLQFDSLGQISARDSSDRGAATIRTCGLDRESLRRVRHHTAVDVRRHIDRLDMALKEDNFSKARDAVDDLLSLGDAKRAHAGMVRSIVLSELGCSWTSLQQLRDGLNRRAHRAVGRRTAGSLATRATQPRRYRYGKR